MFLGSGSSSMHSSGGRIFGESPRLPVCVEFVLKVLLIHTRISSCKALLLIRSAALYFPSITVLPQVGSHTHPRAPASSTTPLFLLPPLGFPLSLSPPSSTLSFRYNFLNKRGHPSTALSKKVSLAQSHTHTGRPCPALPKVPASDSRPCLQSRPSNRSVAFDLFFYSRARLSPATAHRA